MKRVWGKYLSVQRLNMFRVLIYPSSGVCNYVVELPHPNSNTQQIKNETTNVVVQQHSCKLLKMGILMPETC